MKRLGVRCAPYFRKLEGSLNLLLFTTPFSTMPQNESEENPLRDAIQSKRDTHAEEGQSDARKGVSGEDVRVNVRVPPDLHERFKQRAEREGRPISWLIRRFMEHYAAGGETPNLPEQ